MTSEELASKRWESAYDFRRAVIPIIARWLPKGHFVSVEDAPDHPAIKVVDTIAGIDGWIITDSAMRLQGIASRVQYGTQPTRASRSEHAVRAGR